LQLKDLSVPAQAASIAPSHCHFAHQCCVTLSVDCGVTRLGEDWLATSWPTTRVKVLRLCFLMTNDADLLESAVTLVVTVQSSWSTVETIVQASDDIIKVVPKNENSLQ